MQKISAINPEAATGKVKELFTAIQNKFGMVPNMMRTMGHSPAVLSGYLAFNGALGESSLGAKLGEQISITVANANGCGYCNAAHSFIGDKMVGMDNLTIEKAREGKANDAKVQAALAFAQALIAKKGKVNDADIDAVKKAGYSDAAITEIIAYTGFNVFTNYFNNALKVALDFPEAALLETAVI